LKKARKNFCNFYTGSCNVPREQKSFAELFQKRPLASAFLPCINSLCGIVPTNFYAQSLREAGLNVKRSSSAFGVAGALMWLVVADKPV
jgi:hypothetical protein